MGTIASAHWLPQRKGLTCNRVLKRKAPHNFGQKTKVMANNVSSRGGVEDTRLEAKAKDTKKIRGQGQGQPFRGQTLSRPRTKDTSASALQKKKKKVCTKIFQAISKKKGLHKIFLGDLHKKTFSKTFLKRSSKF